MSSRLLDAAVPPAPAATGAGTTPWQLRRRQFQELFGALQSGQLAAAQRAYAAIAGDESFLRASPELTRVGAALQSADLIDAQDWAQALLFSQPGLAGARNLPGDSTALTATTLPLLQPRS